MKNSENTQDCSIFEFSISRMVCTLLKLGNGGKLDSFLTRVIKTLKKEITILKKNLDTLKFNHEQKLEDLTDKLQDAEESLTNSYLDIDVDRISTNESQKDYEEVYLQNIDQHMSKVKSIQTEIDSVKEIYESKSKEISEEIESREVRINTISQK